MRIAGGKATIPLRSTRVFLDCEEQFRHRLIETPSEEMHAAYRTGRSAHTGARAKGVRGFLATVATSASGSRLGIWEMSA